MDTETAEGIIGTTSQEEQGLPAITGAEVQLRLEQAPQPDFLSMPNEMPAMPSLISSAEQAAPSISDEMPEAPRIIAQEINSGINPGSSAPEEIGSDCKGQADNKAPAAMLAPPNQAAAGLNSSETLAIHAPAASQKQDSPEVKPGAAIQAGEEKKSNEKPGFYQETIDRISALQTVEQIIFGVEREIEKNTRKPFDTLKLNKSPHDYQQLVKNSACPETSEKTILAELESWAGYLRERDKAISISALRTYCENTKPALSAKAKITLAFFYQKMGAGPNSSSKFEMLFTMLFSAGAENQSRQFVCEKSEINNHIRDIFSKLKVETAYGYPAEIESLDLFLSEAKGAEAFGTLLIEEFFKRYQEYKAALGSKIFARDILAKVAECNVEIGNRFVSLVAKERRMESEIVFDDKLNFAKSYESVISNAICKTLDISAIEKEIYIAPKPKPALKAAEKRPEPRKARTMAIPQQRPRFNKWLIAASIAALFATGSFYAYTEFAKETAKSSPAVKKLEIDSLPGGKNLKVAKVHQDSLIGVVSEEWGGLQPEEKKKTLEGLAAAGSQKGYKTVSLIDADGKTVGIAKQGSIELSN